jgi:hypothetical protein
MQRHLSGIDKVFINYRKKGFEVLKHIDFTIYPRIYCVIYKKNLFGKIPGENPVLVESRHFSGCHSKNPETGINPG